MTRRQIKELFEWAKKEKIVPIDIFLNKLGIEIQTAAAFSVWGYFKSLEEMLVWSQPGGYRTLPKIHDVGKATLLALRDGLRQNIDLIEALTEHVRVVGTQKDYVRARWGEG